MNIRPATQGDFLEFYGRLPERTCRAWVGVDATDRPLGIADLGKQLVGNHDDKWAFSIALIDKDNFMNYPICEEDAT